MRHFPGFVVALLAAAPLVASDRALVEGIVVRVNERILTTADMRERALERAAESGRPVPAEAMPQLVEEAADELCLLERAAELKLTVGPEETAAAVKQLREQNNVADDATFEQMLASMGMSLEQLRRRLTDTMLVNRVLNKELGDLPLTEQELRDRWAREQDQYRVGERLHLEHVVFPVASDGADREAQLAHARRMVAAARSGGDLTALIAAEVEAGRASGGDLGTLDVADLREEVRAAVAELKSGAIAEPFVSASGVHVVRVLERVPPTVRPFEEVAAELREKELGERYRARLRGVVDELKKRYIVETHPELLAAK